MMYPVSNFFKAKVKKLLYNGMLMTAEKVTCTCIARTVASS